MAFTERTLTHKWQNADGSAASGQVSFSLVKRMTNDGVSIVPASKITATLDGTGSISQAIVSNVDTDTVPTDSAWRVDIDIAGTESESYDIVVPAGPGTTDLGTLLPSAQQVD